MPAPRTPRRRRQRSVRVTVSVALLSVGTAAVVLALPARSVLWLSVASVLALVLAWAALRIMWTEVLQSRRENAADRAAAATAYRDLFSLRAAEHAEFTTAMTQRLAEAQLTARELEGQVALTETRAQRAESRLVSESQALVEATARLEELEQSLAERQAEEADALATWEAESLQAPEAVADMVAWEAKVAARSGSGRSRKRA